MNKGVKMSWVGEGWDVEEGGVVMVGMKVGEGWEIVKEGVKKMRGGKEG